MNKALIFFAVIALSAAASGAYAQSPASGLTTKPAGVAAIEFLDLAVNQKKVDEAVSKYVAPPYTQHNPQVPDGVDGVRIFASCRRGRLYLPQMRRTSRAWLFDDPANVAVAPSPLNPNCYRLQYFSCPLRGV